MRTCGVGTETYLYVNGIATRKEIELYDGVALVPVTAAFHYSKVSDLLKSDVDHAVAATSGRNTASQMHIVASDGKQLAVKTWNAVWDCLLLGAIFHCYVMSNIQCDKPVERLDEASYVNVTNYEFRAIFSEPYQLTSEDAKWIESHYLKAHKLLDKESYNVAVHALASYKWHTVPRVQLAIIWSGIESLFAVSTEISFRISLYIANFLAGNNIAEAIEIFQKVRGLYNSRSAAVHGSKIKGDVNALVSDSAILLKRIIRQCAELGALPRTDSLVFPQLDNK